MTIGPLTLPVAPLILMVSGAIVLMVERLAAQQTRDAEVIQNDKVRCLMPGGRQTSAKGCACVEDA